MGILEQESLTLVIQKQDLLEQVGGEIAAPVQTVLAWVILGKEMWGWVPQVRVFTGIIDMTGDVWITRGHETDDSTAC